MKSYLIRYWFEFEENKNTFTKEVQIGCGVTALNYSDALTILEKEMFRNKKIPGIKNCVENVDIRDLDQGHVIPNMLPPDIRGIWFPIGYNDNF